MPQERLPQQMALSELKNGKRNQCKPKKRWTDTVKDDLKTLNISVANWRQLAADRNEWRDQTKFKITQKHEEHIEEKSVRRALKHEEDDKYSWKCPLCSFTRDGRKGRQYVNSHTSQSHKNNQTQTRITTAVNLNCTICGQSTASKSGLSSHIRFKHPDHVPESSTIKPIRFRRDPDNSSTQLTQSTQSTLIPSITSSSQSTTSQQWACPNCHRGFRSKAGLSSHSRSNNCGVQGMRQHRNR
ncbi:hypothetical protein WDU94_001868 [Cyamophila willieti]